MRFLSVLLAAVLAAGVASGAPGDEIVVFQDDFESYTPGTFPSGAWSLVNSGAGSQYQVVVNTTASSGNQSMQMRGSAPMYAADMVHYFSPVTLTPPPDCRICALIFEGSIKTPPTLGNEHDDSGINGVYTATGLSNYTSDGHPCFNDLHGNCVMALAPNTWYRLKMKVYPGNRTADYYVNDQQVLENAPWSDAVGAFAGWDRVTLHAGWDYSYWYFDDIKVSYIENDEHCCPVANETHSWGSLKKTYR